jgi:hypothetical protein
MSNDQIRVIRSRRGRRIVGIVCAIVIIVCGGIFLMFYPGHIPLRNPTRVQARSRILRGLNLVVPGVTWKAVSGMTAVKGHQFCCDFEGAQDDTQIRAECRFDWDTSYFTVSFTETPPGKLDGIEYRFTSRFGKVRVDHHYPYR